ncbi:hypothetical protein ACI6Q2_17115 [Chitinophagaceae bacterium LWZ2-11]
MRFLLSGEFSADSKALAFRAKYVDIFFDYFSDKNYSKDLKEIFVIVFNRAFEAKQRKKIDQERGTFIIDVMLNYEQMASADMIEAEKIFLQSMKQIVTAMNTYLKKKLSDLNVDQFKQDLNDLISQYM